MDEDFYDEKQKNAAIEKGKQIAKDEAKKLAKKGTKQLIMKIGAPYIAIAALVLILVLILVPGFLSLTHEEEIKAASETIQTIQKEDLEKYITISNGEFVINQALYDKFFAALEEVSMDGGQFFQEDSKYLKAIFKAELASTYPKLKNSTTTLDNDKFQGTVEIIRRSWEAEDSDRYTEENKKDDKEILLTYLDPTSFNTKLEALKKTYNKDDYAELRRYFTIKESTLESSADSTADNAADTSTVDGQTTTDKKKKNTKGITIIIPTYDGTSVSSQEISYQNNINKYSTPIEFMISQIEISQNPEYIYNFADMVLNNCKIELVIQEKRTKTTTETVVNTEEKDEEENTKIVSNSTTETKYSYSIMKYIRLVDNWIVNVKQEYKKDVKTNVTGSLVYDKVGTFTKTTVEIIDFVGTPSVSDNATISMPGVQDHILFVGDSWCAGAKSKLNSTFSNSINTAVGGESATTWIGKYSELEGKTDIKGIYIALGINDPEGNKTKIPELAGKLRASYPDIPIYIQKCFNIASKMNGDASKAQSHNAKINDLNTALESYCSSNNNVYFIDATTGMIENGVLKDSYSNIANGADGDGFHLNTTGQDKWIANIKQALSNTTATLSDDATKGIAQAIPESVKQQMEGISMKGLSGTTYDDLSYLTIPYKDFNGNRQVGHLVIAKDLANEVLEIFEELYNIGYPIETMEPIENYQSKIGGQLDTLDRASMGHNNTSAFCDRTVSGTGSISYHALGRAIDLNPKINPAVGVNKSWVSPKNASLYMDRTMSGWKDIEKKAIINKSAKIYEIFTSRGWRWLGDESLQYCSYYDYQHFEKP